MKASVMDLTVRRAHSRELLEQHVLTNGPYGWSLSFSLPNAPSELFVIEAATRSPEITDCSLECDHCGLWRPVVGALAGTPAESLREAVEAATAALDRAKAEGCVIPPQAAPAIAMLDLTARMLAVQPTDDTPESRDHTVTADPVT